MQKPIQNFALSYSLFRLYSRFFVHKFYKTMTVVGLENIPKNTPVIVTPNHQNTLMDALCIVYNIPERAIFMARSDIFGKSKFISNILRWLKILPIYRMRDGVKQLQNNDESFNEAVGVLEDRQKLVVLPEGSHVGQRRLRILKKGVARIAFQAEAKHNFELGTQIIPAGLDYSHYINFGSRFLVVYGKPIPVAKYKDLYAENPQKAMASMMDDISNAIKPLMLNLDNEAEYETLETLRDIYINDLYKGRQHKRSASHKLILDQSQEFGKKVLDFAQSGSEKYNEAKLLALELKSLINKLNLRYWTIAKDKYSVIGILFSRLMQIVLSPIFAIGFLLNILPFHLPVYFARNVKDPQFLSSYRYVISIITFTVFYLIYLIIMLIAMPKWWMAVIASVAIPYLGMLAFRYYVWFKKTTARSRINRFRRTQNAEWKRLTECYNTVLGIIKTL